jgi:iron(III) transport system ATP-binding protein
MLTITDLCAEYVDDKGNVVKAAQNISWEVPDGKLFTLLGPSGCGKTTTLRSIAGLERPVSGEIVVDQVAVYSSRRNIFVPPNKRNFGMVFQSYAIWPHMNVFENVVFPLRVGTRRFSKKEMQDKVMRALHAVGLDEHAERAATQMSGGQQQRLALARALVMEPKLLLLDEPLSNLDAKLRERMRFELKRMQRELNMTTIYVTHDQSEALALSHEIAVMNKGRIVQVGPPRQIYQRPNNQFVADFVGSTNFVEGVVEGADPQRQRVHVNTQLGPMQISSGEATMRPGQRVLLSLRPEELTISEARPADDTNVLQGKVDLRVFLGECADYQVKIGERRLLVRAHPSWDLALGAEIYLHINPQKCILVEDDVPASKAA